MNRTVRVLTVLCFCCLTGWSLAQEKSDLVAIPGRSPLIDVAIQFETGSMNDPDERHGLAKLTALALSEGSTESHSYEELLNIFYPWNVSVDTTVDKERVTFTATVHKDHLEKFTPLFIEMMTQPKFTSKDLDRLRDKQKNFLTQDLRVNNDEELGKEVLYLQIYPNSHPYGHHNSGAISGLEDIEVSDLKEFYAQNFDADSLILGVSGGYPEGYPERLQAALKSKLPPSGRAATSESAKKLYRPVGPDGRRVTIVEKDTRSVAMSLGFPIEVNRSHPDWAALFLFRSFFGEHRSSNSYLYQRLRELRGLNYGDYAYIEYFPNGMYLTKPEPYYPRQSQIFQIWIRPVQPDTALFTLRATLYELEKVVRDGLTQAQFEATRSFLKKNAPLLVSSSSRHLGYALDSKFYEAGDFVERLREDLDNLTLEQVNGAIKEHIQADDLEIVLVSKEGDSLRQKLLEGKPSPMSYNSEKSEEILREDRVIQNFPLGLDEITVVPVSSFFR